MPLLKSMLSISIFPLLFILSCKSGPVDTAELFKQNFHPYPNVLVKLNKNNLSDDPRELFFLSYRDKDFTESLAISNQISGLKADDPLQLYRAVCMMATGDYDTAIPLLKSLASQSGDYQDAARWYWSLALLKQGKIEECKNQLITLKNTSTYIRNEAKVLMGKLE